MPFQRSLILILCATGVFTPLTGQARPPVIDSGSLTLQQPLTLQQSLAQTEYIIEGAVWTCTGTACHAAMVADMPVLRSCKRVVEVMGAVSQFSYRGADLTSDQLAQCNVRAKT